MSIRRHVALAAVAITGLMGAGAISAGAVTGGASGPTPQLPTLTGEAVAASLAGISQPSDATPTVTADSSCGSANVTMHYSETGTATGSYAGSYTENGTITFSGTPTVASSTYGGPPNYQYDYYSTSNQTQSGTLDGTFEIDSAAGTVTGHRHSEGITATCTYQTNTTYYGSYGAGGATFANGWAVQIYHVDSDSGRVSGPTDWTASISSGDASRDASGTGDLSITGGVQTWHDTFAGAASVNDTNLPYPYGTETGTFKETTPVSQAAAVNLDSLSQVYSGAPEAVTTSTSPAGLDVSVTYDGSSSPPTHAGAYPVIATVTSPGFTAAPASGVLVIAPAPLTVTAPILSKTYGDANPNLSPTVTGFVGNDDSSVITQAPTCSTAASMSSGVAGSPYPITCTGGQAADYTFNDVAGSLAVTPAPLNITAANASMMWNNAVPTIDPTYVGLVNGDTATSTPPTCSTTATSASLPGTYATNCAGASDPNYLITTAAGTMTVTPPSCAYIQQLIASYATNPGAANGLSAKASSVCTASNNAKTGVVGAFGNQADAQTGKGLTAPQAATLKLGVSLL